MRASGEQVARLSSEDIASRANKTAPRSQRAALFERRDRSRDRRTAIISRSGDCFIASSTASITLRDSRARIRPIVRHMGPTIANQGSGGGRRPSSARGRLDTLAYRPLCPDYVS